MKTVSQKFSNGDPIDSYHATAIAEGFAMGEPTMQDQLTAWAYLIRTGLCWQLQGHFGRTANDFIERGIITPEGEISWETVDEILE